jgi:beta-N-acetylhexosaminidase
VIVCDALEMRATRDLFGVPGAAVLAVAAGTDLLCLGRDSDEEEYLAVRTALVGAVGDGTLAAARLEEAADRVARLRGGLTRQGLTRQGLTRQGLTRQGLTRQGLTRQGGALARPTRADGGELGPVADRAGIGLTAARRAARMSGPRPALGDPLIIEVEPRENIAAGRFGWGLAPWAPAGSVHRVSALAAAGVGGAAGILAAAKGRSLVAVVRDAHRDQNTRSLIGALLAARPDLVLVEMGLPRWQPPGDITYLATYGASRANAQAAAELLGLA